MPRSEGVLFPYGRPSSRSTPIPTSTPAGTRSAPTPTRRTPPPAPRVDPMEQYAALRAAQGWTGQPNGPGLKMDKKGEGYGGYSTQGELTAAVTGAARLQRLQDQYAAEQLRQEAESRLSTVRERVMARQGGREAGGDVQRTQAGVDAFGYPVYQEYQPTNMGTFHAGGIEGEIGDAAETFREDRRANMGPGVTPVAPSRIPAAAGSTPSRPEWAATAAYTGQGEHAPGWVAPFTGSARDLFKDDQAALDAYAAQAAAPYEDRIALADQLARTPWSDYAQNTAVSQYGLTPEEAAGLFWTNGDKREYGYDRDAQSMAQYGVPYDVYAADLAKQERSTQDARAAEQARQEAQLGVLADQDKQVSAQMSAYEAQQMQALSDGIFNATGVDGNQLASDANMTIEQVASVVDTPEYSDAFAGIQDAIGNNDVESANSILDQIASIDPAMFRVLSVSLKGLTPDTFDAYAG